MKTDDDAPNRCGKVGENQGREKGEEGRQESRARGAMCQPGAWTPHPFRRVRIFPKWPFPSPLFLRTLPRRVRIFPRQDRGEGANGRHSAPHWRASWSWRRDCLASERLACPAACVHPAERAVKRFVKLTKLISRQIASPPTPPPRPAKGTSVFPSRFAAKFRPWPAKTVGGQRSESQNLFWR